MNHKFYVFGAHSRAQTVAVYIQYLYPEASIEAYLVNNDEKNPGCINGVPVIQIDKDTELHGEYPVFLGTRSVYHENLEKTARELGIQEIYPVTADLDLKLRNAYLQKYFAAIGRNFAKINDTDTLGKRSDKEISEAETCVYVAKSIFDKPLQKEAEPADYEKIIQVGAALTKERLEENGIIDSEGENISDRNKQFCELTGLYWIWKHAAEDIVGLVHYRRHFILPEDWEARMRTFGIDVILPVPLYVAPSVEGNYRERHVAGDWDIMIHYLEEHAPAEFRQAKEIFQKNLYSPCNMFIMRREILNDLCKWMFPIIETVAAQQGIRGDAYQNRYPGFLSERLITLFFEMHRDRYKVVYADKNFLP